MCVFVSIPLYVILYVLYTLHQYATDTQYCDISFIYILFSVSFRYVNDDHDSLYKYIERASSEEKDFQRPMTLPFKGLERMFF